MDGSQTVANRGDLSCFGRQDEEPDALQSGCIGTVQAMTHVEDLSSG